VTDDLYQLYLDIVHWFLDAVLVVFEGLGIEEGYIYGFFEWLNGDAALWLAGGLAAVFLIIWTLMAAELTLWADRRVRARVEGRSGPRHVGAWGTLQGVADWFKLLLKKRPGVPSAAGAALSWALVLGALALLPLGPWLKLADPEWGLIVAAGLLALAPVPMATMAPAGQRHAQAAEATASGAVLLLAIASMLLVGGTSSAVNIVEVQADWGWGIILAPLGFMLFMLVMFWESMRLSRVRTTSHACEKWPGPHMAIGGSAVAARYFALGVLGAVVFLGGWSGPVSDGAWWTLAKAYILVIVASLFAAAVPLATPEGTARAVRNHWLPLASINLVVVAAIVEVMA
jgi:NADH-quinone oxidoreductase subunit H